MKVTIIDLIDDQHQLCFWYGGECARIEHKGYTVLVEAIGDIYVIYEPSGEYKTHCKDKGNNGNFYHVMSEYFKNDEEVSRAMQNDELVFENNNWWELSIIDPQGVWHDLMWCAESDMLTEAIEEAKEHFDEMIEWVEEE